MGRHTDHLTHTVLPGGGDILKTRPGQAHFALADTTETCGKCKHHIGKDYDEAERRFCDLAREMAGGKWQAQLPYNARACKYFEPKAKVKRSFLS